MTSASFREHIEQLQAIDGRKAISEETRRHLRASTYLLAMASLGERYGVDEGGFVQRHLELGNDENESSYAVFNAHKSLASAMTSEDTLDGKRPSVLNPPFLTEENVDFVASADLSGFSEIKGALESRALGREHAIALARQAVDASVLTK